jgi:hypothetical protein
MLQHHLHSGERLKEHRDRKSKDGTMIVSHEQRRHQQHMVLNPPDASRVSAWRNVMTQDERRTVETAVGPLLEDLGYGPRLTSTQVLA